MNTIYYNLEESPLWQPTTLLEDAALDLSAFSLQNRVWINRHELWRRWLRTN